MFKHFLITERSHGVICSQKADPQKLERILVFVRTSEIKKNYYHCLRLNFYSHRILIILLPGLQVFIAIDDLADWEVGITERNSKKCSPTPFLRISTIGPTPHTHKKSTFLLCTHINVSGTPLQDF